MAAVAAKLGLKCRLVQESWVPHEDAVYDRVGNILLTRLMGADSRVVDDGFDIGIRQSWEDAMQEVRDQGGNPLDLDGDGVGGEHPDDNAAFFFRTQREGYSFIDIDRDSDLNHEDAGERQRGFARF